MTHTITLVVPLQLERIAPPPTGTECDGIMLRWRADSDSVEVCLKIKRNEWYALSLQAVIDALRDTR